MLTEAQKELRRKGVSGSEVAALLGMSPFLDVMGLWRLKTQPQAAEDPLAGNVDVQRGMRLEMPMMHWYADLMGRAVVPMGTLVHPDQPLVIATPDAVSFPLGAERDGVTWNADEDVVLEIKCPRYQSHHHWGEPGSADIPEYYLPQVMWEMAVTGLKQAHVLAYFGDTPETYSVPWDQEMFDGLYTLVERFWHDHVLTKTPPPIDGSSSWSAYLQERYPAPVRDPITSYTSEIAKWCNELKQAQAQASQAEWRVDAAKNHLRAIIGDRDGIKVPGVSITWRKQKDGVTTDWKALAMALNPSPDLIAKHQKTKSGPRKFTASFPKEKT